MDTVSRKLQRLKGWDYSQNRLYFVTVCTQNKVNVFGKVKNGKLILNNAGQMVSAKLIEASTVHTDILVDKFIVMPNHLHAMLWPQSGTTRRSFPTTVSEYVQRFKTLTTKLYIDGVKKGIYLPFNKKLWQKSFYDHIIRDENDYLNHWRYIEENPMRWYEDRYWTDDNMEVII